MLIYFMSTVLISSEYSAHPLSNYIKTGQTFCAVFSALRVYAHWNSSQMQYVFPTAVLVLGMVPVGTNIVSHPSIGHVVTSYSY